MPSVVFRVLTRIKGVRDVHLDGVIAEGRRGGAGAFQNRSQARHAQGIYLHQQPCFISLSNLFASTANLCVNC